MRNLKRVGVMILGMLVATIVSVVSMDWLTVAHPWTFKDDIDVNYFVIVAIGEAIFCLSVQILICLPVCLYLHKRRWLRWWIPAALAATCAISLMLAWDPREVKMAIHAGMAAFLGGLSIWPFWLWAKSLGRIDLGSSSDEA